jgi:hypothetical protein
VNVRVKPASLDEVRFFVDEDLAGFGLAMMQLRNDVVVGSHDPVVELVPRNDPDWIPVVARQGWVVITNDRHIRTRYHEATPAIEHGLRAVHLAPAGRDASRWDFMRLLARHWDRVEDLAARPGPAWLALRGDRHRYLEYRPGEPPRLPPRHKP